jgi:hypothetical protein
MINVDKEALQRIKSSTATSSNVTESVEFLFAFPIQMSPEIRLTDFDVYCIQANLVNNKRYIDREGE